MPLDELPADAAPPSGKVIPDTAYAITEASMILRIARRFGQCPFGWWPQRSPGERAILMAQERIWRAEEERAKVF